MSAIDGLKEKILELQKRRLESGPPVNEDGTLKAESHEDLADAYERAFDRCDGVLGDALHLLFHLEAISKEPV